MKKSICIFVLMFVMIFAIPVSAQTDSTVSFGDWDLRYDVVLPAIIIKGSGEDKTQLNANQFIGGGIGISINYKKLKGIFGFNSSILLYSGDERKVYPMLTAGPYINLYKRRIALNPVWDFGKIEGNFKESWKDRFGVLLSINIGLSELFE